MDSSYRTDDPHWPEGAQDQAPLIPGVGGRLHSRLVRRTGWRLQWPSGKDLHIQLHLSRSL